jgi:hypothetical protein
MNSIFSNLNDIDLLHSMLAENVLALGVGHHGGRRTTAAAMVGVCCQKWRAIN